MSKEFFSQYAKHPHYKAPRGNKLNALSWQTEAPLRMFLNNLDAEVAEDPATLTVYGGQGQAARNVKAVKDIINSLLQLTEEESLLIQSGKPVGIVKTHPEAPRVLIANSNLVPQWSNWNYFNELKARGLMMYGQMTAGSWIYIGTQGILQGTYETFAAIAKRYFNSTLKGKLVVTGGLGGMGGAQPFAVTLNGGVLLAADVNRQHIQRRLEMGYLDRMTDNYEEAVAWARMAKLAGSPLSVGLVSDIGDMLNQLLKDKVVPDIVTDQTSAHDPLNGYIPSGYTLPLADALRQNDPEAYKRASLESMAKHVGYMLEMKKKGAIVFDYGNNIRTFAKEGGEKRAFEIPGFVSEFIRPLFCEGKGPFRWVALSGDPEDIKQTDEALIRTFPENQSMINWLTYAAKKIPFQGLPARICWLGLGERAKVGLLFNDLVKQGIVKAPIVIGRDHLDSGSVASPTRETEGMKDGTDAVSDWPLLNLMSNCAGGATWVSFHHGGGVGMGYSQHAGMVILADGTERAAKCLERVLHNDPALGVYRHWDAGYKEAAQCAKKAKLRTS